MRRNTIAFSLLMVFLIALGGFLAWHAVSPISDRPDLPQPVAAGPAPAPRTMNTDGGPSTFPAAGGGGTTSPGYVTQNYNVLRALAVFTLIGFALAGWFLGQRRDQPPHTA